MVAPIMYTMLRWKFWVRSNCYKLSEYMDDFMRAMLRNWGRFAPPTGGEIASRFNTVSSALSFINIIINNEIKWDNIGPTISNLYYRKKDIFLFIICLFYRFFSYFIFLSYKLNTMKTTIFNFDNINSFQY